MKKSLISMAVALCTINIAYAENSGFYVGGQLGSGLIELDSKIATDGDFEHHMTSKKNKVVGAINFGYNFKSQFDLPIRAELSYTAHGKAIFSGSDDAYGNVSIKHRVNSLMVNTYYDIYTGSNFTPYISLGLGTAFLNTHVDLNGVEAGSAKKRNFAYSTALGVAYKIDGNWSADIMARGTYNGKLEKINNNDGNSKSQTYDLLLGVSYNF